jgi:hypothetical protein
MNAKALENGAHPFVDGEHEPEAARDGVTAIGENRI